MLVTAVLSQKRFSDFHAAPPPRTIGIGGRTSWASIWEPEIKPVELSRAVSFILRENPWTAMICTPEGTPVFTYNGDTCTFSPWPSTNQAAIDEMNEILKEEEQA